MQLVGCRMKENDRIAEVINPWPEYEYASARDELLRLSGAFSTLGQLRKQDMKRLAEKGMDPTTRMILLAQMLLPQLCSIIGRGLTLEEVGLLVGLDERATKRIIRSREIAKVLTINPESVEKGEFVKVMVPLRTTIHTREGEVQERPVREPLLARRKLVERVRRAGYVTQEGRVLRRDYLTLVSGPMPSVLRFQGLRKTAEDGVADGRSDPMKEMMLDDQGAQRAELEIAAAMLGFLRPLFRSESAPVVAQRLASNLHVIHDNVLHYASRYRALNDQASFDRIEALARPLLLCADGFERSEWIRDRQTRERVAMAIDKVLEELVAVIQGRALLMPNAVSELTGRHQTSLPGH